jgi:hypothetical protein
MTSPVDEPDPPPARPAIAPDQVLPILCKSAGDALVKTILVVVLGGIALGVVSAFWHELAPTPPPLFSPAGGIPAPASTAGGSSWAPLAKHRFLLVFLLLFSVTAWTRLRPARGTEAAGPDAPPSRWQRAGRRAANQWFSLIVGNAFGALLTTFIVVWVQQFTLTRLLLGWLLGTLVEWLQGLYQYFFGPGHGHSLQAWGRWYVDNQFRFAFWFFYLAAICDDLGLPNFKTLGRWLLRRVRFHRRATPPPGSL